MPTDKGDPVAWLACATDGSESRAVYCSDGEAQAAADAWGWSVAPLFMGVTDADKSEPDWRAAYQRACQEATLALSGKVAAEAQAKRLRLTDAEREAILFCVSCAQDYRDKLDGSEERATQMIQTAMRFAMPQVGPAPVERPRTASVTDVGGAGPTLTEAEREALEVAIEYVGSAYAVEHHARTIRGLLERTRCS